MSAPCKPDDTRPIVEENQRIDHPRRWVPLGGRDEFLGEPRVHYSIVVQQDDIIGACGESATDSSIVPGGKPEVLPILMDGELWEPSADVLRSAIRRPVIRHKDATMFIDDGKEGLEARLGFLPSVPCQQDDIGKRDPRIHRFTCPASSPRREPPRRQSMETMRSTGTRRSSRRHSFRKAAVPAREGSPPKFPTTSISPKNRPT